MSLPRVAFIGTGGTIASIGATPLDVLDYGATGQSLTADEIIARLPDVARVADILPVAYRSVPSSRIFFDDWKALAALCLKLEHDNPTLAGIVIGHGTGSLEETAYFLSLTLKTRIPVVITGSQRPISALSSDAGLNLVNALRTAASPDARGLGVLVLLNDEIHAARDVTKTSTTRMQTFRAADFGALGHADGDAIVFYRRPLRGTAPNTEFDITSLDALPRVDIATGYTGSDGTAIRAYLAAGAKGLIYAGFAPGMSTPDDFTAMQDAVAAGAIVMQCTRAGSGRVFQGKKLRDAGILVTDNLTPQKARLLLALALTRSADPAEIARMFATY
jgi:L-asparaginase